MRALLATTGSEGDIQPFLALGQRLLREGHEVTLATSDHYATRAGRLGIPHRAIGVPWSDAVMEGHFVRILAEKNPLRQLILVVEAIEEEQRISVPHLRALAEDADVVIYQPLLVAAAAVARALSKPHVSVHLAPLHRARNYSPTGANFGRIGNYLLWTLAAAMMRRATDARLNTIVAAAGLPPWQDVLLSSSHSNFLDLVAVSPTVLERDPLSKPEKLITGYWFVDEPPFEPPPELLAAFADEPPVVIGFGSMQGLDATKVTRTILAATEGLSRRVVLQSGWAGLGDIPLPSHVTRAGFVPHSWLHARAACIVHHGGAGTTASALRAGVPQAIVWHLGDQPMWGKNMERLGVAPATIPHHALTAPWLRKTLDRLLTDETMIARAKTIGDAVRAEDGTGVAVRAIEKAMSST